MQASSKPPNSKPPSLQWPINFFFASKHDAHRFVKFLESVVPIKWHESKRLISQDFNNNTYNYKYTYSTEIVPVCKHDIVCLPKGVIRKRGYISPICLCTDVGTVLHFIDPYTLQTMHVENTLFWKHPFGSIASHGSLIEFFVLDVEYVLDDNRQPIQLGDKVCVCVRVCACVCACVFCVCFVCENSSPSVSLMSLRAQRCCRFDLLM